MSEPVRIVPLAPRCQKARRRARTGPSHALSQKASGHSASLGNVDAAGAAHIALQVDEDVVLGVITGPVAGHCWWAIKGGGAYRGVLQSSTSDQLLRVSGRHHLPESTFAFWAETADARRRRDLLQAEANLVETTMDCIIEVAAGEIDLAICDASSPWDLAPGAILVEEAGGRFTDPAGGHRLDMEEGWYSNGLVHEAVQDVIRQSNAATMRDDAG